MSKKTETIWIISEGTGSTITILSNFKLNLIWMQLKYESFIICFKAFWWIFFESTSAKYIIMLTFDNVESRSLIHNKFSEISIRKVLFWASEEHSQ